MPIAWKGTLAQYAGRLHRLHDAKREVIIYDYVDMSVPVLARMAAKRRVGYQTIGYRILGTGDLFSDQSVASEASGEGPATFSVWGELCGISSAINFRSSLVGRGRHPRTKRRAFPQLSVPAGFGRHPQWRDSGAPRASAPFAGFLSVGHLVRQ
jgi:superfamily II DNA or RNA helicase